MMRAGTILAIAVVATLCLNVPVIAHQPSTPQNDFVQVTGPQPAVDSLPAAPLLIAAYAFVWVALLGYLWFVWSRLKKVQTEIEDLQRRTGGQEARK